MNYAFSSGKRILPLLLMLHLSLCLQPAWAQTEPLASPSPVASVSPSPDQGPSPAPTPSASFSPDPSLSPSPDPSLSPSPSASPMPAPSLSPEPEWIPRASPSPDPTPTPEPPSDEKNPWLAAGFSLLLPGSGQMYVEERVWPEVLITAGMALAVVAFVVVDQQRAASIKDRTIDGATQRLADAHWDALTLLLQIGVPSLWLWNAGDAFSRAERSQENVIPDLETKSNAYIIEENLVSVTLWQF